MLGLTRPSAVRSRSMDNIGVNLLPPEEGTLNRYSDFSNVCIAKLDGDGIRVISSQIDRKMRFDISLSVFLVQLRTS